MSKSAIAHIEKWAKGYFQVDKAVAYLFDDEEILERHIASIALLGFESWQAAEVWIVDGHVTIINALGQGMAPNGVKHPWRD